MMKISYTIKNYTLRREDGGHVAVIDEHDSEPAPEAPDWMCLEISSWCDNKQHKQMSKLVGHDVSRLEHRQRFNGKKLRVTIEALEA